MPTDAPSTILLVEDSARLRPLFVRILQSAGYSVLVAGDLATAMERALEVECRVDLLITDVMLPDSSGLELARQAAGKCPGIKILFMSGYRLDLPEGSEFIEKPFRPDELLERVQRLLNPID